VIWAPFKDGRTSVRAAYAVLSDQPVANVVYANQFESAAGDAADLLQHHPVGQRPDDGERRWTGAAVGGPNFTSGRMQSWNVNVERQFGADTSTMIGYFGSKGDRLRVSRNLNQFINGVRPFPAVSSTSAILPGTALGNITEITSLGFSHYQDYG
jgi:hypothetical protein